MEALDQIKARVEKAVDARLECDNAETDAQEGSLSIRAAFIAEQSSYDVPKLLAALEAVEGLLSENARAYRQTADVLNQRVIDRTHDRDVDAAARYACYASSWEAAKLAVHRAIEGALQ